MTGRAVGACALVLAFLSGCSAAAPPGPGPADDPGTGAGGGAGGSGGDGTLLPDAGDTLDGADFGDGSGRGCSGEAQLVYVVDYDRKLYQFDPPALAFTEVGELDCASTQIFSMAVDRDAVAWALATDGTMIRYDIHAHACKPIPFASGQHGFLTFGMGFSSDSKGGSAETLFVSSASTLGLAAIDTQTLALTPIGPYDGLQGRAELTGTGDARLFGVFEQTPYVVAEIGKPSAEILSQAPQGSIQAPTGGSNFAFAFWGGDFWLFVGPGDLTTNVYRFKPSDGTTTQVTQTPLDIVGAGVSTCAPTTTPK